MRRLVAKMMGRLERSAQHASGTAVSWNKVMHDGQADTAVHEAMRVSSEMVIKAHNEQNRKSAR